MLAGQARNAPLTRPRPGHADLAGMQKYGFDDARPVLERASARETAARVALGAVAQAFLRQVLGVEVVSHVVAIGPVIVPDGVLPGPHDNARIDEDPVRCADPATSERDGRRDRRRPEERRHPRRRGRGGRRTDCRRAWAATCTGTAGWTPGWPARSWACSRSRRVEVGDGLETARRRGRWPTTRSSWPTAAARARVTDRAGGIEGGMTNGEVLRVRAAMKPISTVPRALATVDTATGSRPSRSTSAATPARCPRRRRRGGDGGPGARRGRAGEVRRRLGRRDPPQHRGPTSTRLVDR